MAKRMMRGSDGAPPCCTRWVGKKAILDETGTAGDVGLAIGDLANRRLPEPARVLVVWKEFRTPAAAEWCTLRETHTFRVHQRDVRKPCPLVESLPEGAADER